MDQVVMQLFNLVSQDERDIYLYQGSISREGYTQVCNHLAGKSKDRALLILGTNGGDPNAGYRVARAFLNAYGAGNFAILVPGLCKSAGTLMCVAAAELIIADQGELGPLDIQVSKPDEMFQNGSGLDVLQAIDYLETAALNAFKRMLVDINRGAGITTRSAASMAERLVSSLYQPVMSQIEPVRLGEMQRAINIAKLYGDRLNSYHEHLMPGALDRLIWNYPAHEFVIDRKEAGELFSGVREPTTQEAQMGNLSVAIAGNTWQTPPIVLNLTYQASTHFPQILMQDVQHSVPGEANGIPEGSDTTISAASGTASEGEPVSA
ncbi:SDH family Clp fold serine proteinase [Chromobacterium violaceum]|uniref:SDH family Clp fold serine proteinase n=1 Tax=Chromobacterium violaceum TaxID=536 RepID=UPI001C8C4C7B|nr:hypothetical protein [Chromobacterium violaceum]MBX9267236.1 hypothetical protein [Chromobacterium violaceum]